MDIRLACATDANEDDAESNVDFVARLPKSVQESYSNLIGRKDILSLLKKMHSPDLSTRSLHSGEKQTVHVWPRDVLVCPLEQRLRASPGA